MGVPVRNFLITTPSTLVTMLPMLFHIAMKAGMMSGGLPTEKNFSCTPYNAGECPFANITRKLQSIISDIEKMKTRYQMIQDSKKWAGRGQHR